MKPKPKPEQSRAGKRAPGQTTATISLSADILATAKRLAAEDGRSLSNWLRRLIERNVTADEPPQQDIHSLNETASEYQVKPRKMPSITKSATTSTTPEP